jgi:hypothetical protein
MKKNKNFSQPLSKFSQPLSNKEKKIGRGVAHQYALTNGMAAAGKLSIMHASRTCPFQDATHARP